MCLCPGDVQGFLSAFNEATDDNKPWMGGMMDFAGSGVVHMCGGVAALVGAAVIGPRKGRFADNGTAMEIPGHSSVLAALGTFILWFGWYGFNCGSTLGIHTYSTDAARVAVTTTLSPAMAAFTVVVVKKLMTHVWDLNATLNGVLAGLVSITAGCVAVDAWASLLIGFIGAFVYLGASKVLIKCKIDDPLDAFAVHGACGFWGVFAVGLFCPEKYSYNLKGDWGIFYGGNGTLLGVQIVGLLVIVAWTSSVALVMFMILKKAGFLRVSEAMEDEGMDTSKHGGQAYNLPRRDISAEKLDKQTAGPPAEPDALNSV